MEKLSLEELQRIFEQPRMDHPSRKSIAFGEPALLPKGYRSVREFRDGKLKDIARDKVSYGEFIPNPPGCVGLRSTRNKLVAEALQRIKTARALEAAMQSYTGTFTGSVDSE